MGATLATSVRKETGAYWECATAYYPGVLGGGNLTRNTCHHGTSSGSLLETEVRLIMEITRNPTTTEVQAELYYHGGPVYVRSKQQEANYLAMRAHTEGTRNT